MVTVVVCENVVCEPVLVAVVAVFARCLAMVSVVGVDLVVVLVAVVAVQLVVSLGLVGRS